MDKIEKIFGYNYQDINQLLVRIGTNLVIASIIFVVGFWLAKMASKGVRKVLVKSKTDESLISFLASLANISLKALVIITGINQLGIEMTSFVAILGAAGLAVGMAFSGTLSNFAGGVMILAFKPFKVGDTIKSLTEEGKVKEIQIFNTYLHTADNKVVILPNGPVANGNIINYTREGKRRVDIHTMLPLGIDVVKLKEDLLEFVKSDKRVLPEPKPIIGIKSITHEYVELSVLIWGKTSDHSHILHEINGFIYQKMKDVSN